MSIENILCEMEGRAKDSIKAGCLPSDDCLFDGATGACVYCGRKAGTKINTYDESWKIVSQSREDIPRLIAALRKAIEQRDAVSLAHTEEIAVYSKDAPRMANDMKENFDTELASILRSDSHGGEK